LALADRCEIRRLCRGVFLVSKHRSSPVKLE
jgi:hypothetical protein